MAAEGSHFEVLEKLWDWVKQLQLLPEELWNGLFLSKDKLNEMACHLAAGGGHVEVIEKLCDWAKELQLKPEEMRNEVCLSNKKFDKTLWSMAAYKGHLEVLDKLWDWAKEMQLKPEELWNELSKGKIKLMTWQQEEATLKYWRNCGIALINCSYNQRS